jgi:nucleoside-diphosphate-sugar epimerase
VTINGDGGDKLDFTYISDLVEGIILCIVRPEAKNQIFNITYGRARSLNQMAEILREHFPQVSISHNPRDQLMPERGTLSVDKARWLIGYAPEFPLERGFAQYIQWYKDIAARHPQLLRPQ